MFALGSLSTASARKFTTALSAILTYRFVHSTILLYSGIGQVEYEKCVVETSLEYNLYCFDFVSYDKFFFAVSKDSRSWGQLGAI